MEIEPFLWLTLLAALPIAVLAAYGIGMRGKRLYFLATVCAGALTLISTLPLFMGIAREASASLSPLSLVMVPFAAFLWFLAVVVTPSGRLNEAGLARTAAACLLEIGAFFTVKPLPLILIWIATSLILVAGHSEKRFAMARRIIGAHLGLSTIFLVTGAALWTWAHGHDYMLAQWGIALILIAVMIRKGIFPFHAWIPEIFECGRIGPVARFNAPQIGTYVALILAIPYANAELIRIFAVLALITAAYCSIMALYQADARRACGYLFVSQSALVIAGLDMSSREALVGAMLIWICSGVALAGLSRAVLSLEARRGRLRLDILHGGYERMPLLAISFLIMSLAIANFPGTLSFIGGEMLVRGTVDTFPGLGLFVVLATALNGLAAMRMYFSLFCGRRDSGPHLKTTHAENLGFALAAVFLVGFGLAPSGLARIFAHAKVAALQSNVMGNQQ